MAKGSGSATGGPRSGHTAGSRPFVATPGREEARIVQRDIPPPRAAERLMAQQDQATSHPGPGPAQVRAPARVMSTDWVEQDRQARMAQAARSVSGQPMPAPGGTVTRAGPTPTETQTIEAMRARMTKAWGIGETPGQTPGAETRRGRQRAWTAELPGKRKDREEGKDF